MIIIMLGAQGTGKGTVAGILSKKTGWPQVSTGDIFRKSIAEETPLGLEAHKYISEGNLVPDEITIPMVASRLNEEDAKEGAILDGFPRTVEQAKRLDAMLKEHNRKVDLVVNLTTPRDEIITRILNRRVCSNQECKATYNLTMHPPKVEGICDNCGSKLIQREDDASAESIQNRLNIYDKQTSPVVDYYEEQGLVIHQEVSERINHIGEDVAEEVYDEFIK